MDLNALLEQAKRMQNEMSDAKDALAKEVFKSESQQGMVQVEMNGAYQLLSLSINEALLNVDDKEILQDMILMTINQVIKQVQDKDEDMMGSMAASMKLPGM